MKKNTFYAQLYGHVAKATTKAFKDEKAAYRWFLAEWSRMIDDHNLRGEVYWISPAGERVQLAKLNLGQWKMATP